MIRLGANLTIALCLLALTEALRAQQQLPWTVTPLPGGTDAEYDLATGTFSASNGVMVSYGNYVLTAKEAVGNPSTGEVVADGKVRVQQGEQLWVSEHLQ